MARNLNRQETGEGIEEGDNLRPSFWGHLNRLLTVAGLGGVLLGTQLPVYVTSTGERGSESSADLHDVLSGDHFIVGEIYNNDYAVLAFSVIVVGAMIVATFRKASLALFLTGIVTGLTIAVLVLLSSLISQGMFSPIQTEVFFGQGYQMGLGQGALLMLAGAGVACFGALSGVLIED